MRRLSKDETLSVSSLRFGPPSIDVGFNSLFDWSELFSFSPTDFYDDKALNVIILLLFIAG